MHALYVAVTMSLHGCMNTGEQQGFSSYTVPHAPCSGGICCYLYHYYAEFKKATASYNNFTDSVLPG